MRKLILLIAIVCIIFSCKKNKTDYQEFKKLQDYNVPLFKDTEKNKSALLILPHTDDEIVCAGTIDYLKKKGWVVSLITLTKGQAKEEKNTRESEWKNAVSALKIDNYEIFDLPNNSWENVLSNKIDFWYDNADSIESIVYSAIYKYKPSVIFTYDTTLGAYGHPEHRVTAKAATNVFQKHKAEIGFPVERVLQITLPENLEQKILGHLESYINAKKYTGNKTLPEPTVAFDITHNWTAKRNAAAAYSSQAHILQKFFQLPEVEDTAAHYKTFDREYYFEVKR